MSNGSAVVYFLPPSNTGGGPIISYVLTATPVGGGTPIQYVAYSSPATIPGLVNGTEYDIEIAAVNALGEGAFSLPYGPYTPEGNATAPGMPTGVVALGGNGQAVVSFSPPNATGGSPITGYTVTSSPGSLTATGGASPLTVTGLTNGTSYTFTVTATNAIGTGPASSPSNSIVPATVPGVPLGLVGSTGNGQISVSFSPPISNGGSAVISYTVTSSPGNISVTGTASPIVVTGLTNGTSYTFTATATNAIGTGGASAPSSGVIPYTVPGAPTGLAATGGNAQASVTFTAPVSNGGNSITSYTLTASPGGFTYVGSGSPIVATGLTNGTTYSFTCKATNAAGSGPQSSPSNSVTPEIGQVATVAFSPTPGSYTSSQTVTLSCSTSGSTIYYTTDGSTPTTGSSVYGGALTVASTETINALAARAGYANSVVSSGSYVITTGAQLQFSFPNFAGSPSTLQINEASLFVGNAIQLFNSGGHNGGTVYYKTKQNILSFTTTFTFQFGASVTLPLGSPAQIAGMTFCIQNQSINAGGFANECGFGTQPNVPADAIYDSIAVMFDQSFGQGSNNCLASPQTSQASNTGLMLAGGPLSGLNPADDVGTDGINYLSFNVMSATITYDGTYLTLVIMDTITGAQARRIWPVNISHWTGASTAWVGFTGNNNTYTSATAKCDVLSWQFSTGNNTQLATPVFGLTPGQYTGTQTCAITVAGAPTGTTIYYSTNGSRPTSSSTKYTGPVSISSCIALQAVAINPGYTDSYLASGNYQINTANIINYPSGFGSGHAGLCLVGGATVSGSGIQITYNDPTGTGNATIGGMWWGVPVNVQTFTTSFTLTDTNVAGSVIGQYKAGLLFVVQNYPLTADLPSVNTSVSGGPTTLGPNGTAYAYAYQVEYLGQAFSGVQGIIKSVAVKFDCGKSTTGMYENAALPGTSTGETAMTGITLSNGHPLACTLTYDGTTLSLSATDTVTSTNFSHSWTVNIPGIVGANTAYVGFVGGSSIFGCLAVQTISSMTYHN